MLVFNLAKREKILVLVMSQPVPSITRHCNFVYFIIFEKIVFCLINKIWGGGGGKHFPSIRYTSFACDLLFVTLTRRNVTLHIAIGPFVKMTLESMWGNRPFVGMD